MGPRAAPATLPRIPDRSLSRIGWRAPDPGDVPHLAVNVLSNELSHSYSVCGLNLSSEFECPELYLASGHPDIRFLSGQAGSDTSNFEIEGQGQFSNLSFFFAVEGVARYRVFRGEEIAVEPFPRADPFAVRLFLLSTGLGALLQQRRVPVLHGSAIVTQRGAVVFAGRSGAGKSTLAAAFHRRGYSVLTDELSALRMAGEISILPGPSSLMVWRDVLKKLAIDPATLVPVRPELQKYFLPLGGAYKGQPAPLMKIYIIETSNGDTCSLQPIRGFEKFKALAANLYRPGLALTMGLEGEFSSQVSQLASQTEVIRVIRPRHYFRLDELTDLLERDLA